ncbi:MAG: hypothetical protein GX595_12840, partial [Lentisphaerae bacterium]|nr:hypothetical protein [Lentisphaerota bacterium]
EAHQRAEGHPERLVVTLARQAQGPVGLAVRLSRRLAEPDLLAPTGKAVALPLGLPRADPEAVLRENGRLVVYGPDSLRLSPQQTQGLRGIAPAVAVEGFVSSQREGEERPAMAFAFGADPVALTVSAERRRPHLTVGQLLVMRIASGVVRFEATLQLQVLYSGVSSLRLDLPEAVAAVARVTSPGIRYRVIDDPAGRADLLPGMVAWSLSGDTEFLGGVPIGVVWEMPLAQLDVGSTVDIAVPRLVPRGVDRAWGQLVLAKAESIEVTPAEDRRGLRAIDPQHDLMPGARAGDAAHAFEFHDGWALTVQATRYEPKDVKATSIERGLVTAVVTRGDLTSVQAVYAMRSARQRLTVHLPGEVDFDTQPLHINGRPVALEQGAGGDYVIPLTGQTPQAAFLVELRYTVRGQGLAIAPPSFPEEPAAQRLCLSLYLPQERAYLGHRGPWNDEIVWTIRGFSSWPRGRQSQAGLQAWVAGPLTEGRDRLASFATDGRHLLFATLRPIPGPEGALRVAAVSEVLLRAVVVLVGLALGLALLRSSGSRRAVVIGALFCAGLLAAVFVPSLSRACLSNAAVAAGLVV